MRILYGVCSDGLGHAMRARVVATHLRELGHEVTFATAGAARRVLGRHGFSVIDARSMKSTYTEGRVSRGATLLRILREAPARLRHNARGLARARSFDPHVVLTDFSGFACVFARAFGRPVVSLDHQHVLSRFRHPRSLVGKFAFDFDLARVAVDLKTPGCDHYLVTSFYFPELLPGIVGTTTLLGPLLRPEVRSRRATSGRHVVVYQTAAGDSALLPALTAQPSVEFRVYGGGEPGRFGNVAMKRFDEASFLDDLASARALVTNGGFSTISEALYWGKPVLSVPLLHQAEQELNAAWLSELGFGRRARRIHARSLGSFLECAREIRPSTDPRLRGGNREALAEIEHAITRFT